MARYRDPWKKKSAKGMNILAGMAKTFYKIGKSATKKRKHTVPVQSKGCMMLIVVVALVYLLS